MYKSRKAGASNSGSKTNDHFVDNQKAFSRQNYTSTVALRQCTKCDSDYMNFAVDGYCQRCQQRVEYILQEHHGVKPESIRGRRLS